MKSKNPFPENSRNGYKTTSDCFFSCFNSSLGAITDVDFGSANLKIKINKPQKTERN